MKTITLFEGDGIGPEITSSVIEILNACHLPLEFEKYDIGQTAYEKCGELIPNDSIESIKRNKVALKAPVTTPIGKGFRSVNVQLRMIFDLYANVRPAKLLPNIKSRYDNIDLIVFRENTEDLYIGEETVISPDEVHAIKKITRKGSERIIRSAFEYAIQNNRKKVTCVHKANILKKSDGLFLDIFNQIKEEFPQIEANDLIVDNACMQLVMRPEQFDIMVMPNLYGDILSDLTSGLIGGLGLLPSAQWNDEYAIFEAVHGSAPDIAGKNMANPTALLLSACMMLDYLGHQKEATQIRTAINKTLENIDQCTVDIGGHSSTSDYTKAIIRNL
ncbi:isocitrate/isopropylmalate dehydrogenase family protein [Anaerorhabdus sp.]|uniref:isocitrate/isopropylmalate dehydrogenase family protein n=1 Tax=Anaerorhabdus sp. TaxID=1872524 RepID=UPI002FC6BDCF